MPVLRAMDFNFTPLAYIDSATSIQWTRKLWEIGTFEIHLSLKAPGADKLKNDAIIFLSEHRAGIIDKFYEQKTDKGSELVISGKELKNRCKKRGTVPGQLEDSQYFGYDRYPAISAPDAPIESIIKHYVDRQMVNPEDIKRAMSLIIAADLGRGVSARWSSRFEALTAVFKSIGETYGVGYEIYLDMVNSRYIFDTIHGNDHTTSSSSPVVFSTKWSNIASLKYSEDKSNYYNTAYCGGAGENEGRLIQIAYENDTTKSGEERNEIFIDCGSIDDISELISNGKNKLQSYILVKTLTGDIVPSRPYVYMRDWDLGDLVTLQSKEFDVEVDEQITEVKEVYERGKVSITPTFGKRHPNIVYDEIRRYGSVR